MAAGLRDLLALQGVIPVSAGVATANPGLTLNKLSGVWIDGAAPAGASAAGFTLNQLSGVWINGAPPAAANTPGFVSWNQLSGVWINASGQVATPEPTTPGGGSTRHAPGRQSAQQAHLKRIIKEDMEIVTLILAALQSGIIQ